MININQTGSTLVALTLSEKVTLTATSVYFLFEVQSQDSNAITRFTAADISTNPLRYNLFRLSGTSLVNQDLTQGAVYYPVPGYYTYACYQQLSPTNISLTGVTGGPIEYGKMYVSATTNSLVTTNVRQFTAATPEIRYVFQ